MHDQNNTAGDRLPFPEHLRRPTGAKKDLADEDVDREVEKLTRTIEKFPQNKPPESEFLVIKSEPEKHTP